MVRAFAKIAAASGLAAALATPLTLGALADTAPVSGAAGTVTTTVGGAVAQIRSSAPAPVSQVAGSAPMTAVAPADPPDQAPPGTASANALSIAPLDTCISCTSAFAGPGSASANSTALRILGQDVSAGGASGPQSNNSGALIALPANPLLSLAVADWMASAQSSDTASSAASRAALVDLNLDPGGNEIATLAVLEAGSNASWTPTSSSGSAYTNGVNLNVGNGALVVILLHSGADSSGTSHTYVASINGNELLSNTQVGQPITITIPGVLTITLLQTSATGGAASAAVGTVTNLLGMGGQQAGLFQVATQGAPTGQALNPGAGVQAASTGTDSGLGVPETGVALGMLGVLLAAGGAVVAAASRITRRRANA